MTRPKDPQDMHRPNRRFGDVLREILDCPLCGSTVVRVVAYRRNTVRIECPVCELRFSLDVQNVMRSISREGSFTNVLALAIHQRHDLDDVRGEERDRKRDQRHPDQRSLPDEVVRLDGDLEELAAPSARIDGPADTGGSDD